MNAYQAYLSMAKQATDETHDHSLVMPMAAGGAAIGGVAHGAMEYGGLQDTYRRHNATTQLNSAQAMEGYHGALQSDRENIPNPEWRQNKAKVHEEYHAGRQIQIAEKELELNHAAKWKAIKNVGKLGLLGGATAGAALGFALKNPEHINKAPDLHYHDNRLF